MSIVSSIFCPLCINHYDLSERRPRLGKCPHTICEKCLKELEDNSRCPICKLDGSFDSSIFNYALMNLFEDLKNRLTEENFEKIQLNSKKTVWECGTIDCSATAKLRICVTCATASGSAEILPNGSVKVHLELGNNDSKLRNLKKALVCSNCILDNAHQKNHRFERFDDHFKNNELEQLSFVVHGDVLKRKLKEDEFKKELKCKYFEREILKYRAAIVDYRVFLKMNNWERMEDCIMLANFAFKIDLPELMQAKNKSLQIIKKAYEENSKLRQRLLQYQREEISDFLQYALNKSIDSEDSEEWQRTIQILSEIREKYEEFEIIQLDAREIEQIDTKIDEHMERIDDAERRRRAGTCKNAKQCEFPNNSKLEGLLNEMEELQNEIEIREKEFLEKTKKVENVLWNRYETNSAIQQEVARWENEDLSPVYSSIANAIFLYEITDQSLIADTALLLLLNTIHKNLVACVIKYKYFPNRPENKSNEEDYTQYFCDSMENIGDKSWLLQILFAFFKDH